MKSEINLDYTILVRIIPTCDHFGTGNKVPNQLRVFSAGHLHINIPCRQCVAFHTKSQHAPTTNSIESQPCHNSLPDKVATWLTFVQLVWLRRNTLLLLILLLYEIQICFNFAILAFQVVFNKVSHLKYILASIYIYVYH